MNYSPHEHREKRLKVSRACFTCRVKKIKCDGLYPCMQCKARSRPCSFSKDGKPDETQSTPDIYPAREMNPATTITSASSTSSPKHSILKSKELLTSTQKLDKLSMMWPGEGKEGKWLVDINLLYNGSEKEKVYNKITLPIINSNLINLFFRHRYSNFPILPKSIFYRLLDNGDPFINPLLLYSMYCNASHFSNDYALEADNYFQKAKELLEETMNATPTLSTVISLCLLSTFESNRLRISRNSSSVYSEIAFRLCYDLKLHKRYSFHGTDATPDMNELCKRVYWSCYCLDKIQSLINGRPCILYSKEIEIDFPMVFRSNDSTEYEINTCFIEHIKLMQIVERILQLDLPNRQLGIQRSTENEQLVLDLDQQLLFWLKNLPQQLQWTPLITDHNIIPTQPPPNALVAHLHLIYNFIEIYLLQPHTSISSSTKCLNIKQRSNTVATNITQLTCAMADQPNYIVSFNLVSEAIISAVRIHIIECADEKLSIARHARFMFQRSLRTLKSILHYRIIDNIQELITMIENALIDADTGNSSSRNNSPKLHVLSPLLPRNVANTTHEDHSTTTIIDERWSSRFSSGIYPYGLISPTSSTTSTSIEKNSNITRDEELVNTTDRPHHPVYNSTMDSYRTPFTIPETTHPSPIKHVEPIPSDCQDQQQQQQHMEMYSNLWSKPTTLFPSNHHLENAFISTLKPHIVNNKNDELYSLWDQPQSTEKIEREEQPNPIIFIPQQTGRYGLGVYASAQQHHTDVIRQHMPGLKSSNSNRPVLLNHHGQVVVASSNDTIS